MSYDRTQILRPMRSCSCEVRERMRTEGCPVCAPENFCHHGVSLIEECAQCVSEAAIEEKLDRGDGMHAAPFTLH